MVLALAKAFPLTPFSSLKPVFPLTGLLAEVRVLLMTFPLPLPLGLFLFCWMRKLVMREEQFDNDSLDYHVA